MTVPLLTAIVMAVLIIVTATAVASKSSDDEEYSMCGCFIGLLIVAVLSIAFALGCLHGEQAATGQTLSIGAPNEAKQ